MLDFNVLSSFFRCKRLAKSELVSLVVTADVSLVVVVDVPRPWNYLHFHYRCNKIFNNKINNNNYFLIFFRGSTKQFPPNSQMTFPLGRKFDHQETLIKHGVAFKVSVYLINRVILNVIAPIIENLSTRRLF